MKYVIALILIIAGGLSVLMGGIAQAVLCYQKFGALFEEVFIPHVSALLYLGVIPMFIGAWMLND